MLPAPVMGASWRTLPSRAIDLGCGTGSNAVFLAQHGFDVTGIDYSSAAIEKAQERARAAKAPVNFLVDDLVHLRHVTGPCDLLVDYGVLDDLRPEDRDLYVQNVLPLAHPGTRYLLYTWEWPLRWWERATFAAVLEPGEVERRFGAYFEIEPLVRKTGLSGWPHGFAVYLMTRNGGSHKGQKKPQARLTERQETSGRRPQRVVQ